MRPVATILTLALCMATAVPAVAETYLVKPDSTGDFPNIQTAVDSAATGDIIELADGVYTGPGNHNVSVAKAITIRSQSGNPDSCVVYCESVHMNGFQFYPIGSKGVGEARLENIGITEGSYEVGGGISCLWASPTIVGCKITRCNGIFGGGIGAVQCSPSIIGCTIQANLGWLVGGGIFLDNAFLRGDPPTPLVDSCLIEDNMVFGAVGIDLPDRVRELLSGKSDADVLQEFSGREKQLPPHVPGGAGVCIYGPVAATVRGCTIRGNAVFPITEETDNGFVGGAGILCQYTDLVRSVPIQIQDCEIHGNFMTSQIFKQGKPWAPSGGGGIMLVESSPTIVGCLVDSNSVDLSYLDPLPGKVGGERAPGGFPGKSLKADSTFYPGGAGILCFRNCSPVISDCVISRNEAPPYSMLAKGQYNVPVSGGGISCQYGGSPEVRDCEIVGNVIPGTWDGTNPTIGGGGVFLYSVSATLLGCEIHENFCGDMFGPSKDPGGGPPFMPWYGGGLCCVYSDTWIEDCTVADNMSWLGAGCYMEGSADSPEEGWLGYGVLYETLVAKNYAIVGGGLSIFECPLDIVYSTISGNTALLMAGVHEEPGFLVRGASPWQEWGPAESLASTREFERFRPDDRLDPFVYFGRSILWGNCDWEEGNEEQAYLDAGGIFECCDVDKAGVSGGGPLFYDEGCVYTDPMFCCPPECVLTPTVWPVWEVADFRVDYFSPCTKRNSPCGERIGARGVGCRGNRCEPWEFLPPGSFASVLDAELAGGTVFRLLPPTPNPFNPMAEIHFSIPSGSNPSRVTLTVYNALGQKVRTLVDEDLAGGMHRFVWDGRDENGVAAASGVYFCNLGWGGKSEVERMVLLK
jgi:hypothetical protein